jgi:hypothetical protein
MTRKKHRKRIKALYPYVREIADKMGLKDWGVTLGDDYPEEGANASASFSGGRKYVVIRFKKKFYKESLEDLRETVCHELIHCHFAFLDMPLENSLGPVAKAFAIEALEYGIDALCEVVALAMPLPPKID